jgi:hypothetical protein
MSVVGFVSPPDAHPCGHCGNAAGGNVVHLSATAFAKTPARTLSEGSMWSADLGHRDEDIYVCDICLWSVLRGAFGHLLDTTA